MEGLVAEVPGRQTVPRAELWGASLLLERAPLSGPFEITMDAAYVVNGLERRSSTLRGMNGDLWSILCCLADRRDGPTVVSKVKSHVIDHERTALAAGQHHRPHVVGNELADAAASTGAAIFGDNGAATASRAARQAEEKALAIAIRLGRIQAHIWTKRAGAAIFEPPELPCLDEQLEETAHAIKVVAEGVRANGHHLARHPRGLRCVRCGLVRGSKRNEFWTTTKCRPRLDAVSAAKRIRLSQDDPLPHPPPVPFPPSPSAPAPPPATSTSTLAVPAAAPPGPGRPDTGPAADRPTKRARWTCLLDDDDARRWVIEGSKAEEAHRAAGGKIYNAELDQVEQSVPYLAAATQGDSDQDFADDVACAADRTAGGQLDFGFDNSDGHDVLDAEFEEYHQGPVTAEEEFIEDFIEEHVGQVMVCEALPAPRPAPRPGEDGGHEHTQGTTSAPSPWTPSAGEAVTRDTVDAVNATAAAAVVVGAKRRRLTTKTCPSRAAEMGYPPTQSEEQCDDEEGLVTQGAAAAARARIRERCATHRRKVRAARSRAWDLFSRQPDFVPTVESANVEVGGDVGDVESGPAAPVPAVPSCWDAHASHEVAAPSPSLMYCRKCGAWSGGHRVRGLALPCRGAVGHKGNLRLLALGIAPVRGARVPAELKRAGARGSRGGSATRGTRRRRRAA